MSSPLTGGLRTEPPQLPENTCPLLDLRLGTPRSCTVCILGPGVSVSRCLCVPRTWVAFTWDPSGSRHLQPARPLVMPRRFRLVLTDLGLRGFQQRWQAWYLGCSSPGPVDVMLTLPVPQSSALGPALLPTEPHASWTAGGPHLTRVGLRLVEL